MNQVNAITSSKVPGSALPLLVAGAFFMENLDATVIVTAMPQMASAFAVHPIDMNIGISAYILTLTVFIPASGWIANRFGARNVCIDSLEVRKKPGGHWIIRDLMGLDLVGLASL